MPFDFFNIPIIFQKYINKILAEKLDIFIIVYLNNILIYTKNLDQPYIKAVYWILDQFQKYFPFTNLKKYYFYQNEIWYLEYIVLFNNINMEAKKIKIVKKSLESKLI